MSEMVRVHIFVSGLVQGVFFRAETEKMALKLGIKGWMRNAEDGRVEAVFEGEKERVERLIEWAKKGSAAAVVKKVDATWEEYRGDFKNFEIRYGNFN